MVFERLEEICVGLISHEFPGNPLIEGNYLWAHR
jgi:hypothetical protein